MAIATVFSQERPRLVRIAYRMLGSWADAEDVVGDVAVQAVGADPEPDNPSGWLTTVTVRRSLDLLRRRARDRDRYPGQWLPEPEVTDPAQLPAVAGDRQSELSIGFLHLAETLTPVQRAVIILRSLGYPHGEIAGLLEISADASRQHEHRARNRLGAIVAELDRPPGDDDHELARRLLHGFLSAARDGDTDRLINLLHDDVIGWSDGGGRVTAARRPILGSLKVTRFAVGVARRNRHVAARWVKINGRPGAIVRLRGARHLITVSVRDGKISAIYDVANPDKQLRGSGQLRASRASARPRC